AGAIDYLRRDAREWRHRRPGLGRGDARQRRDHDAARLGWPPGIDNRAPFPADVFAVPHPCLGIDRLTDRTQESQRAEVMRARILLPHFMKVRMVVGAV